MAFSYNPDQLGSSKKDQVRFLLGDTNEADALLKDEEIMFLLAQNSNDIIKTATKACASIIASLSSLVDFTVGPYSESQGNRLHAYKLLYEYLLKQGASLNAPISQRPTTKSVFHYDMMSRDKYEDKS